MRERARKIVKGCKTPGEAAQLLNKELFRQFGVKYSTQRRKANQSPSESIEQGLASCTGLSILLVDACRSVNVPARLVGVPSWTTKRGNHTWVEVWDDGNWHFTGAAEYDAAGLDKAWFVGDASKADKTSRRHSIYAISFPQDRNPISHGLVSRRTKDLCPECNRSLHHRSQRIVGGPNRSPNTGPFPIERQSIEPTDQDLPCGGDIRTMCVWDFQGRVG